jgi:hypothetical protein
MNYIQDNMFLGQLFCDYTWLSSFIFHTYWYFTFPDKQNNEMRKKNI